MHLNVYEQILFNYGMSRLQGHKKAKIALVSESS